MPRTTPDTPAQFRQPRAGAEIFEPPAETSEPLPADLPSVAAPAPIPPAVAAAATGMAAEPAEPAELPTIEIQTTVEHRGRTFTVVARGYTLDQLCDMLDRRKYQPPTPQSWQTLPDGTPLCPKHKTPMKLREKQGDQWYSHSVGKDASGKEIYCKGYHGKDSPGYDQ